MSDLFECLRKCPSREVQATVTPHFLKSIFERKVPSLRKIFSYDLVAGIRTRVINALLSGSQRPAMPVAQRLFSLLKIAGYPAYRKAESMRSRNHRIVFYLNDTELDSLERKVKRSGLSREGFIRKAVKDVQIKEAPPAELPQFIREIRRVGSNIDQILMIANARGLLDVPQLRKVISDLRDMEKRIVQVYTDKSTPT